MKKVLSILLAVLMLASLCTVAITSVSAEEVTPNDLGVTVISRGEITDDPTGTGEKVLPLDARNDRPNFELADPEDNTKKWEPVAGTTYTVTFDYYFTSVTKLNDFALCYGAQSAYAANYSKVQLTTTNSGISAKFAGDGKWHSASMTFTAYEVKGKVAGEADQVLPYLYLTYYGTFKGYVKNINIVTETAASNVQSGKYNFDWLFNEDGSANTDYFTNKQYQTSDMTDSFVNEDGENVFVVTDKGADLTVTNGKQYYHEGDNVIVATKKSDGSIAPLANRKSYYTFAIKYKVLKLGDNGKASIGFGRDSTTAANCLYQYSMEQTSVSSEWQYFYATYQMTATASGAPITIALGGPGAHIALDSIQVISVTKSNENSGVYVMNDNGEISLTYAYAGTSITKDGANAENVAMGEKFIGWSDAPTCEEVIDAYPAAPAISANAMVYAKYPTVILDNFNAVELYTTGNEKYGTAVTHNHNGTITVAANSGGGFRIPAYDAPATDGYKFPAGQKFLVNFYYNSIAIAGEGAESATIQMIPGERYGTGYFRQGAGIFGATVTATEEPGVISKVITNGTYSNTAGEPVETLLYRGHNDHTVTSTIVIDKITITDMSLTPEKDMVAVSTRAASGTGAEYVSAGIRFKAKITEDFRASATEIGFYAVPTAALNGMSLAEYVETANNIAVSAKVMADGMDEIIYAVSTDAYGRTTYDYQMILTGLTKEGVEKSLCNTKMTVALYAVVGGEKVFTDEVSYSYNDFAPAQ